MSLVGFLILLIEIVIYFILLKKFIRFHGYYYIVFSLLLFLWHQMFAVINWDYSLNNTADSTFFYEVAKNSYVNWGVGSKFVINLLSFFDLISQRQLTYLDGFILFSMFGLVGHLLLVDAFSTIAPDYLTKFWWIHFIPGLHFWTVAIGKDGLAFLAVSLFIWALVRFKQRLIYASMAAILLFFVRPHMALVLTIASFGTVLFTAKLASGFRIVLGALVVIVLFFLVPYILDFVKLDSLGQLESYVNKRQYYNQIGGSGIPLHTYSLPLAVVTYLFRPLFVDTSGVTGMVVSIENMIYILGFGVYGVQSELLNRPKIFKTPCVLIRNFIHNHRNFVISGYNGKYGYSNSTENDDYSILYITFCNVL